MYSLCGAARPALARPGVRVGTTQSPLQEDHPCGWAGVVWRMVNEHNNLYVAVYDSLATADKLGYTSIALPAISCGEHSFPEDRGTWEICSAAKDFLEDKKETPVRKVSLIDLRHGVVQEFHRNLGVLFGFCVVECCNKNRHQSTGKSLCFLRIVGCVKGILCKLIYIRDVL